MANSRSLLTKTQISDQSGVKIGRVKYYMRHFSEFFPEHDVTGRAHPLYEESAIETVAIISRMIGDRHTHDQIKDFLQESGVMPVYDMVERPRAIIDGESSGDRATTAKQSLWTSENLEATNQALSAYSRMVDELGNLIERQEGEIASKNEVIKEQQETIEELKKRFLMMKNDIERSS